MILSLPSTSSMLGSAEHCIHSLLQRRFQPRLCKDSESDDDYESGGFTASDQLQCTCDLQDVGSSY